MKNVTFSFLLLLLGSPAFSQVQIIAHRGASYLAPENTVAAAKLGWELNADAVEIDIYLSNDGQVMVNHDHTTKRTGTDSLVIAETHSDELRKLDVGRWKDEKYAGEKMPFVSEVLEIVPKGKKLVIEIKCGPEVLPALKKAVKASGKKKQVVFIAFGWETILETKKQFPKNDCYWLSSKAEGLAGRMNEAAQLGLEGVNLHYKLVNQEVMGHAARLGLDVLSWTVDDPDEAKRLVDLGVSAITTNRPAWLREQLYAVE
ncbi:glycerophosphodiester phosphodiesterase [Sunxiuqinia dokdonensis]|nr:glycerophosphodiester phosphodiesterase [Sunxiuqinia dokdonensis]